MQKLSDPLTAVPGISLPTLFSNASQSELRKLIDPSIIDIIKGLDANFTSGDCLPKLAEKLIEPSEALCDEQMRECIIRMLPLHKAQELGQRLGVNNGLKLYTDICSKAANNAALDVLYSFFGVVRDSYAFVDSSPDAKRASAKYALFDHQRIAAKRVMRKLGDSPRKVVLHMPTGAGKTRTAMHIIATHLRQNEPAVVCWLAQNSELLEQAADEFENAWCFLGNREIGIIRFWGNRAPDLLEIHDGIIISGLGKMSALNVRDPNTLLRLADRVSLTIIDEAHQAIAPTYKGILTALYSKRPRNALLGLTATPGRTWSDIDEDRKLSDYFEGNKVMLEVEGYKDPVSYLIDKKYLARPEFRTLNYDAGFELSDAEVKELSSAIDVPHDILTLLGADTQRNLKIVLAIEDLLENHRRIIVFAPSVVNARILTVVLSLRGHEAFVVTSETNPHERERSIRRFRSNASGSMVIVNYGVLTTGFDAPETSAAVIARPTRSLVLYSQMVGRATRGTLAGGNDDAEIVTVVDPQLPGFGSVVEAFNNWEDVWDESDSTY